MRGFILKIGLFFAPLSLAGFAVFLLEQGDSDSFYLKFTSPKQSALVIGTSRAAQGIMPAVLNQTLGLSDSNKIFNYAFTAYHSSYGPSYYESIKKKLSPESKGGCFILAVDPWSLSSKSESPNDTTLFTESTGFVAGMDFVAMNPNLEYMFHFYPDNYFNIILARLRKGHLKLHDDGWLEVNVNMDSLKHARRSMKKLVEYGRLIQTSSFSETRCQYLLRTIAMLKAHGEVYLVRLPVLKEMLEIEQKLMPEFDSIMKSIAVNANVPYYDMTSGTNYLYTDGNHLHKSSSKDVSLRLAKWISHERNQARLLK